VLRGELARIANLRVRSDKTFVAGCLPQFFEEWQTNFAEIPGFTTVKTWLQHGVDFYDFFTHYSGIYRSRKLNSVVPPPMYFPNAPIAYGWFVTETILKGLKNGSMKYVGKVGKDSAPRVVNALSISVEPTKNRLILSMKGVNLFCKDTHFQLQTLAEIVKGVKPGGYFSSSDDVNGYKQIPLHPKSWKVCGFQWSGHYFVDTCLSFGWKNAAYIYTTTGNVISQWLRLRGVHTSLWIDDRFVGQVV
jgi:hypothetical protein